MSDGCVRRLGPRDLRALLVLQKHVLAGTISARLGPHCNTVYHRTMLARDDGFTAEARVRRFGLDAELYVLRLDAPTAAEVRPR